ADFKSPEKVQATNFDNFIDFLNKNKLKHIYSNEVNPTKVPLDEKLKAIDLLPPIGTVSGISMEEMVARWEKYYHLLEDAEKRKNKKKKKKNKIKNKNKKKYTEKDKKITHLEGT